MKNKKKIISIIILIVFIVILIGGGTYAWFKWRSSQSIDVSVTIDNSLGLVITFNGGSNITGELEPTITKEEGVAKAFTANTNGLIVPMKFWLKINSLPSELRDSTFKWELLHSGHEIANGDFSSTSIASRTENGETDYYLGIDCIDSNVRNYTLYIWIDGNVPNASTMASKTFNFDLYATVSLDGNNTNIPAYCYISYLYTDAEKSTATVNNVTYNLASSVGLLNDRLGSMDNGINSGNIRYYGDNPDNYAWLGDTYESSYTFRHSAIIGNVTRDAGDKKLWRIIGVFDGKLKLITNDPISDTALSWDTSASSVNNGNGINQWGPSGNYKGADLMKLLNPGYETNDDLDSEGNIVRVNNSLYWTGGTGTVYTDQNNSTTTNVSFANTGLSNTEKNMIDTATWYLGAYSTSPTYVDDMYITEKQGNVLGKICVRDTYCTDTVVRTRSWRGKVGLIYASDYGYATNLAVCQYSIDTGALSGGFYSNNWLSKREYFTITPNASSYLNSNVCLSWGGTGTNISTVGAYYTSNGNILVYPSVYLKSEVTISGGTGTEEDPYVLTLS